MLEERKKAPLGTCLTALNKDNEKPHSNLESYAYSGFTTNAIHNSKWSHMTFLLAQKAILTSRVFGIAYLVLIVSLFCAGVGVNSDTPLATWSIVRFAMIRNENAVHTTAHY
jgi:hypothetical protein